MDRLKNFYLSNKDQINRRILIFVGTGAGIALAAYAYARATQEPQEIDIIVVEEKTDDSI